MRQVDTPIYQGSLKFINLQRMHIYRLLEDTVIDAEKLKMEFVIRTTINEEIPEKE